MTQRLPQSARQNMSFGSSSSGSAIGTNDSMGFRGIEAKQVKNDIVSTVANPMGDIEQPSYHFKFFVSTDTGVNPNPGTIIAETGLTSFNITEVIIEDTIAPNFRTKNLGATNFTIHISEPMGLTLPDKMVAASVKNKIKNFMKTPYYLSVDFLGYDPTSGAPKRPVEKTWVWQILINDLQSEFDETGGRHTLQGFAYRDIGALDQFGIIKTPINIDFTKGEGKLGDVIKGIEKQINASLEKSHNSTNGGSAAFKVKFEDMPYPAGGVVARPFDHKLIRDQKFLDSSRNQGVTQISRGTDIGRLIDYLLSVSETATQMINPQASPVDDDGEAKEFSTCHRIDMHVENKSYDQRCQDYEREITYTVRGYDSVRPMASAKGVDDSLAAGKKKLSFLLSQNYLKKEYKYLYTGENTEVVDFKINLNFSFAVANNLMQSYVFTEMASSGIQYSPEDFNKQQRNEGWQLNTPGQVPLNYCVVPSGSTVPTTTGDLLSSLGPSGSNTVDDLDAVNATLPTTFVQDGNDPRVHVNQALESTNLRTRGIYSVMMLQLYANYGDNLANIDLTIRGDPYWIGVTNVEDAKAASTDEIPNFSNGEHVFMVKFMLPHGIDESTGMPKLSITDTYSGFYAAQVVRHQFSGGTFTQTLTGVRIPSMQVTSLVGGK